jgi:DNA replication and repair protein RecF
LFFEKVELRDFRLYHRLEVEFQARVNAITGPNASGKTTILESLGVLATGRSIRGAADAEMVRRGCGGYRVTGRATGARGSHSLTVSYASGDGAAGPRKSALVDGKEVASVSEFAGTVPLISFSPDDLALVKSGPVERRRFLDFLTCQTAPSHRDRLSAYQRALVQRNALLADLGARRVTAAAATALLEPWDEAVRSESARVQAARSRTVEGIVPGAREAFRGIDGRNLGLVYAPDEFDPGRAVDELRRGVTVSGAHRDELLVTIDGEEARRYASQGQQRSAVLALKLAALDYLERSLGETPVLLLDDVMSELDPGRASALLPLFGRGQVVVTSADQVGLESLLGSGAAPGVVEAWFVAGDGGVVSRV